MAIISRREILSIRPLLLAITLTGVLLFEFGLSVSMGSITLPEGPWVIDGPILTLFGMGLYLISAFFIIRSSDLETIEGVPILLWILGSTLVSAILYVESFLGTRTTSLYLLLGNAMLLICTSLIAMASRRDVDRIMSRTETNISESILRGDRLISEGRPFYGLQQLDLALRMNPVDGFGKPKGSDNPLFRIEGSGHTSIYNFSASQNELALNEKGLIFCTQGRFSDAIRSYQEATKRDPDYLEPYWNLSTLLSTMPGKQTEGMRYTDYLIAAKTLYMRKWMKRMIQEDHGDWMGRCLDSYRRTLRRRSELLSQLSAKDDVWAYYRIAGS
jgi:ABC-type transport system involved in multi-copper enzyme maturation permease subunit